MLSKIGAFKQEEYTTYETVEFRTDKLLDMIHQQIREHAEMDGKRATKLLIGQKHLRVLAGEVEQFPAMARHSWSINLDPKQIEPFGLTLIYAPWFDGCVVIPEVQ